MKANFSISVDVEVEGLEPATPEEQIAFLAALSDGLKDAVTEAIESTQTTDCPVILLSTSSSSDWL